MRRAAVCTERQTVSRFEQTARHPCCLLQQQDNMTLSIAQLLCKQLQIIVQSVQAMKPNTAWQIPCISGLIVLATGIPYMHVHCCILDIVHSCHALHNKLKLSTLVQVTARSC